MVNIKGDFPMGGHPKEVQSISITSNRSFIISFIIILILSLTTGIAVVSANESPEAERNYPDFSVTVEEGESQEFSIDVSHDGGDLGYVEWYVDGELETSNSISGSSDTDYYTHTFAEPGNELVEAVTYTEDWESGEQISWDVTIEEDESEPPEAERNYPSYSVTVEEGESQEFSLDVSQEDGELGYVEWYVDGDLETTNSVSGRSDTDYYTHTFAEPGNELVEAVTYTEDWESGEQISWDVTVEEEEDTVPESWADSPDEAVTITEGESVDFVVGAEHDDGELHGAEWYVDHSPEDVTYGLSGSWDTDDWSRTFDDPGTYTVEADVFDSDDDYNDEAAEWTVTVEEEEEDTVPESWADSPDEAVTITEGESVNFVVGAEHDDGELHGAEWYVDHSPEDVTYGLSGWSDTDDWSHTFEDPGTYTVEADVFDADDDYNDEAAEWTVTVEEEEEIVPESWADSPDEEVTITEGESVNFVVGAEHDDGELHGAEWYVDHSAEDVTYGLSGSWDTDDWSRTFDDPGTYTVEADVFDSDDDYNHEAVEWTVTVEEETSDGTPTISRNDPVTASVVVDEGDTQEFEVEVSDPGAGLESLEWYVNGENEHTGDLGDDPLQTEDWSQTFDTPGEYTIEAVVTNDEGSTDSVSWNVSATDIQHEEPILDRIGSDDQISTAEGSTVDFTVTTESDAELSGLEWRINGEIETEQEGLDGTSARESWSKQFDEPGEYQVTAVVFDEEQQYSNSVTWQVNVEPAGLTVEVINRDGTPISDAEVTLYGIGEGVTDDSGEVVFHQSIDSETRLVVDDGSEFSSEFRDVSPEEEHIVVEVTQGERIFVTIMDDSGDPVSDTTVSIQGSDISGETNEIGSVTFSEELLPRRYDLSIEGYESRTIVVEPGEEAYTVQTQRSEDNGLIDPRTSAFSRGVVCGDPCWNAELYNEEYSMEFFSGWIGASVATPFADARDLGSSVQRGDATDASLALLGVGSSATLGASAVPKSVSKVGKYLQRYPGQTPQMGRFLLESRVVPDEVFYRAMPHGDSLRAVEDDVIVRHLDEDVNPGALGRLADEGADLANARIGSQVTEADINRIAQEGRASEAQLIARAEDGTGVRWLDEGGETNGWDHISSRHVTGEAADSSTDLFPTGHQGTPQRMGEDDVKDLIYQGMTSQRGQVQSDANRIVMEASDYPQMTEYGINKMRVIVSPEGRVITAYPTQGPAVTTP